MRDVLGNDGEAVGGGESVGWENEEIECDKESGDASIASPLSFSPEFTVFVFLVGVETGFGIRFLCFRSLLSSS